MGFKMPHTVDGVNYPDSYWRINSVREMKDGNLQVVFVGYPDKAARDADIYSHFPKGHLYIITKSQRPEKDSFEGIYNWALKELEGAEPFTDDEGNQIEWGSRRLILDERGRPKKDDRKSFFHGAEVL